MLALETMDERDHSPPPVVRRRLEDPTAVDTKGRTGCLAWGAVLGVLAGLMFALYGLKPILRAVYGEDTVPQGTTWEGEARRVTVVATGVGFDPLTVGTDRAANIAQVVLQVSTNKTWNPGPSSFQLEVRGVDDWIEARPEPAGLVTDPPEAATEYSFRFNPGDARQLVLIFDLPAEVDPATAELVALHTAGPPLKFELPPPRRWPGP